MRWRTGRGGRAAPGHLAVAPVVLAVLAALGLVVGVAGPEVASPVAGARAPGPGPGVARTAAAPSYPDAAPAVAAQAGTSLVIRGAPADDASLHDLATGELLWEGPLPFRAPVVYPDVAALDGGTYLLAAVPCATIVALEDAGPECAPGGVTVATFDPVARRFEVLAARGVEGRTPYVGVLGRRGVGSRGGGAGDVILQVDGTVHRLPAAGGDLVPFPSPPLDHLSAACLGGDRVTVVEQRWGAGDPSPAPGTVSSTPAVPFAPLAGASLDLRSGRWTGLGGPAATYGTGDTFVVGCAGGDVLAAPAEAPRSPASPHVSHVLDADTGAWGAAAPPPAAFVGSAPPAWDGDGTALSVSTGARGADAAVLVFDVRWRAWSTRPGGDGAHARAVALDGVRLVTVAGGGGPEVVDLRPGRAGGEPGAGPAPDPPSPARDRSSEVPASAARSGTVPEGVPAGVHVAGAGTGSVDVAAHEWNMCGNVCNAGSAAPADVVVAEVPLAVPRPWTVALTEVCLSGTQHARVVDALDDLGYHAEVYVARSVVAGCGGTPFGNVVLVAGAPVSTTTYAFPTQDGSAEVRGVVCSQSTAVAGGWLACATHLDNSAVAAGQEDDLFAHLALAGGTRRVVGGDYNLTPDVADLDKWRAAYDELDEAPPFLPTIDDGRKLDYVWISDAGDTRPHRGTSSRPTGASDHRYYRGRFQVSP
ncbi:MAG TPA: endonuclease/exonuclease/phosphatase family protein [Acidimicrobiales bacterium]|nr:endonuclease/exonuclease/phosphatase family protein [Acidimicrobiales bacterium]